MKHMKLASVVVTLIGMSFGAALAQSRPMTTSMSCDQARSLVATQGAAVLSTSATAYDRYVASGGYCIRGEVASPAFVPTANAPRCFVGSRCVPHNQGSRS
jgi:hypothetical protein